VKRLAQSGAPNAVATEDVDRALLGCLVTTADTLLTCSGSAAHVGESERMRRSSAYRSGRARRSPLDELGEASAYDLRP